VLNESGGDNDTRIEGDTDANLLFVDASADRVGFGTNTPTHKVQINGASPQLSISGTAGGGNRGLVLIDNNGTKYNFFVGAQNNVNNAFEITPSTAAGGTTFSTPALVVDSSGRLGIGETSPSTTLDVKAAQGRIKLTSSTGTNNTLLLFNNTGGNAYVGLDNSVGGLTSAYALNIFHEGNYPITFSTNNTERARISAGGFFKASDAGTYSNATGSFHELRSSASDNAVKIASTASSNPYGIDMSYTAAAPNGTGNNFLYCADSAALRASIRSNGGLANYQSNNVDLSDERTKKDITPAPSYWDKIGALEIVTYKYNDQTHDDVNVGVIAQQVESVEPVWVDQDGFGETPEGEEPLKTVYTKDITFAAIKALQEAMTRIEALEAEVAALKGAN